jgi:hypothetical protein
MQDISGARLSSGNGMEKQSPPRGGLKNGTDYFLAFFFGAAFFFMVLQAILLPPYESELP